VKFLIYPPPWSTEAPFLDASSRHGPSYAERPQLTKGVANACFAPFRRARRGGWCKTSIYQSHNSQLRDLLLDFCGSPPQIAAATSATLLNDGRCRFQAAQAASPLLFGGGQSASRGAAGLAFARPVLGRPPSARRSVLGELHAGHDRIRVQIVPSTPPPFPPLPLSLDLK
jgi:hypothetical protein